MGNLSRYFFGGEGLRSVVSYLGTMNYESQAIAADANVYDIQSTGTKSCMINGVYIPALTVDAAFPVLGSKINGLELADDKERWFAVFATAAGTLEIMAAGDAADIGGNAVLKIPAFDPTTYVCLAVILYANDAASAAVTFGATDGGVDWGTDGTIYQVIGPVFPHPDNLPQDSIGD